MSKISSKGQVTVPLEVRRKLGLLPGTPVEFDLQDGVAILRKGTSGAHPVEKAYGLLHLEKSVDESLEEMRGPGPFYPLRHLDPTRPETLP